MLGFSANGTAAEDGGMASPGSFGSLEKVSIIQPKILAKSSSETSSTVPISREMPVVEARIDDCAP